MATIGSQALVRLVPYTHYDFSGVRDGRVRLPVAQHIDVLGFQRATLQVRVRSGTLPAGSSVRVEIADDGFEPGDPATELLRTTGADGKDIAALELGEGTVLPFYQSVSTAVPGVAGRMMAVLVTFTAGPGPDGGPSVALALDLVLSGGSVGSTIHQPSAYLGYAHEQVERLETFDDLTLDDAPGPGPAPTPPPPAPPAPVDIGAGIVDRLVTVLRELFNPVAVGPDYPRFGNVNVAVQGQPEESAVPPGYPRFGNVNVAVQGQPEAQAVPVGYPRFGNVNVAVQGQPEAQAVPVGYPRFGNVNVAVQGQPAEPPVEGAEGAEG